MRLCLVIVLVVASRDWAADGPAGTRPFPRVAAVEPRDAAATFRGQAGFRMDLLAAEPLVTDPVAIAYDEDGLCYVLEMNDYPYTEKARHKAFAENPQDRPIGRVRVLEDTDGDGVFDQSTVFADGLSWPTGIACHDGGVYVVATPDLWYLKSTKGDRKADVRRKVFTGFHKLNVQAVANNLAWGLDNKIYGAGGSNGGTITSPDHPERKPINLARSDFRFDPRTEVLELLPGGARFGNTFDDWGNRFVCNIRNPCQHVVIEGRYLARNPYLAVPSVVHDVAESGDAIPVYRTSPYEQWRDLRGRRWATDGTAMPRSELVAGGVVTSSAGVTVYRGAAYPPAFRGQWFLGEPANNLILRQVMSRDGVTFVSRRLDAGVDFMTSTDTWCRPVNFTNAPDGTLHVCDMYREVIEHPWSIPDDIHARLDLESGRDRGRIYRLSPPGFKAPPPPRLGGATVEQRVAALAGDNSWWRETAQRLLVNAHDPAAVPLVRRLFETSPSPLGRLHALWTLQGMGAATDADVRRALADAEPGVRQNAVRVAEHHLKEAPAIVEALLPLADDPDLRVRFQAALTLGDSADPRVTDALASILRRDAADPWVVTAALSSAAARADALIDHMLQDGRLPDTAASRDVLHKLAVVVGARAVPGEVDRAVVHLVAASAPARMSVLSGLGDGLKRQRKTLRQAVAGGAFQPELARDLADAQRLAGDVTAPPAEREPAIHLVGLDDFEKARQTLTPLLDATQPERVQRAAVAALAASGDAAAGGILVGRWASYTPAVRADVVTALMASKPRIAALLDAVEQKRVDPRDVPASRRASLLRSSDDTIRARAAALFAIDPLGTRKDVVERYLSAAQLKGDPGAGRKTFDTICAACHRLGDEGNDVGPNLATARLWSAEQLIVNILDPNREVAPQFIEYTIETTAGETLSGVIADETAGGVTLKWSGGQSRTIPRQEVKRMTASRLSLMPEGLEASLTPQQMADLVALLRGQPK